jgi:hypothetical protein
LKDINFLSSEIAYLFIAYRKTWQGSIPASKKSAGKENVQRKEGI